jgi:hypothetical protein
LRQFIYRSVISAPTRAEGEAPLTEPNEVTVMAEQLLLSDRETTLAPTAPAQRAPFEIPPERRRLWSGNTFVHLTVLVAAAIIVVLFSTQWDRWVGLAVN